MIKRISLRLFYEVTSIEFSDAIYFKRKHFNIVKPVSERQALAEFNVEYKTFLSKTILFINVKFKCIQSKKNVLFYQCNPYRSRYYRLPSQTIGINVHLYIHFRTLTRSGRYQRPLSAITNESPNTFLPILSAPLTSALITFPIADLNSPRLTRLPR